MRYTTYLVRPDEKMFPLVESENETLARSSIELLRKTYPGHPLCIYWRRCPEDETVRVHELDDAFRLRIASAVAHHAETYPGSQQLIVLQEESDVLALADYLKGHRHIRAIIDRVRWTGYHTESASTMRVITYAQIGRALPKIEGITRVVVVWSEIPASFKPYRQLMALGAPMVDF